MPIYFDKRRQRWKFDLDRYVDGRRRRTTRLLPKGWSRAEAQAFERVQLDRIERVQAGIARDPYPIARAVTVYLTERGPSLKSRKAATEHLAAVAWAYESAAIEELPAVAREIRMAGDAAGWSAATIMQRIGLIRAACRYVWKVHHACEHDPAARLHLPKVKNARQVAIDRAEMLLIAQACPRRDIRGLIRLSWYTGLRLSELRVARVDGDLLWIPDSKNGEPRAVPIHPRAMVCLRYLPPVAKKATIDKWWDIARCAAGMPHVRWHDLRHSTASALVSNGVDLFTVGRILGHKDPRSTARYAHHATDSLRAAVRKIDGEKSPHPKAA